MLAVIREKVSQPPRKRRQRSRMLGPRAQVQDSPRSVRPTCGRNHRACDVVNRYQVEPRVAEPRQDATRSHSRKEADEVVEHLEVHDAARAAVPDDHARAVHGHRLARGSFAQDDRFGFGLRLFVGVVKPELACQRRFRNQPRSPARDAYRAQVLDLRHRRHLALSSKGQDRRDGSHGGRTRRIDRLIELDIARGMHDVRHFASEPLAVPRAQSEMSVEHIAPDCSKPVRQRIALDGIAPVRSEFANARRQLVFRCRPEQQVNARVRFGKKERNDRTADDARTASDEKDAARTEALIAALL